MLAGLPYVLWPVGSVFILATRKKDDPFLHYHAVQGLIWGAVALALSVAGFIALALMFRVMPGSSTYLPGMLGMVLLFGGAVIALIVFFTALFLAWRATAGEMLSLPFAGSYAEERMLDHTGMTRREFMRMLEESFIEPKFDEPEPIPFPEQVVPALQGRAQEILAQRSTQETTPASLKAAELLAQRAEAQAQAKAEEARRQAALAQQQKAAALQAQQAAALQAAQRNAPPPATPRATPSSAAPRATAPSHAPRAPQAPATPRSSSLPSEIPGPASRGESARAKSYPLISGKAVSSGSAPTGSPSQPKVKDVDLVRHYKERSKSSASADALKGWLGSLEKES